MGMCDCIQLFNQIWSLETASLGATPGNKTLLWKLPKVAPGYNGNTITTIIEANGKLQFWAL